MGIKETLRKAAGLLIELPPETPSVTPGTAPAGELDALLADLEGKTSGKPAPTKTAPTKTVEQIVRDAEGPNLEQIRVSSGEPVPISGEGQVEFATVYKNAGLPAVGFTAEQMLELLASLPSELPLDTKRHTVRVSLGALGKTMGATPETIVSDASRKLAALHAYVEQLGAQTDAQVSGAQQEIAALEAQIEAKRKAIQEAKVRLTGVTRSCEAESDRLDDILEFFSLDLPPSRYAGETK
jgi:hypothetical protein